MLSSFADLESGQSPGTTGTGCGEDDHGADNGGGDAEVGVVEDAIVVDGDDGVTPAIGVFTDGDPTQGIENTGGERLPNEDVDEAED